MKCLSDWCVLFGVNLIVWGVLLNWQAGIMNILCWNCQGLGSPRAVGDLDDVIRRYDPNMVFLLDTRLSEGRLNLIRRKKDWNGIAVSSRGASGAWGYGGKLKRMFFSWVIMNTLST